MVDRLADPARCAVAFDTVEDFRAQFRRGASDCFVPYPDELEAGRQLIIDLVIGERATFELLGTVTTPDFDERGNIGVLVALETESREALDRAAASLDQPNAPTIVGTTRVLKPRTLRGLDPTAPLAGDSPEPLLEPGTTIDERFRVEAHLATGGMGEVYRANHIHLKRPVALKLLRREFAADADMWARFQREAELVSQLESPHVVRVFDFGRMANGQPYLAMEYVEGDTLDVELGKGPLPVARAVELLVQICAGLGEAHALGVIHRDLKPANLMVGHRRDGSEVVKILDFGIARLSDSEAVAGGAVSDSQKVTRRGLVVGTPAYFAPEQALGDSVDQRTDLYALGCVAYELLTGGPPFGSTDLRKVVTQHLTAAPKPLPERREELAQWPAVCAAVLRVLAKDPNERFATASEFAQALTQGLQAATAADVWPPLSATVEEAWPPPAASAPPAVVNRVETSVPQNGSNTAVDDFFSSSATEPALEAPPEESKEPLPLHALRASASALPPEIDRGAFVFLQLQGTTLDEPAGQAWFLRVAEIAVAFGGFLDASTPDSVTLGFASRLSVPSARAALAATVLRDALAELHLEVPVKTRAALAAGAFSLDDGPRSALLAAHLRALASRAQPGQVACEKALAQDVGLVIEVQATSSAEVLALTHRRPSRRHTTTVIGRDGLLELLERRLQGLTQGVVAPLVVQGPPGAGRTAIATELAARARQRSQVVAFAAGSSSWKHMPCGAVTSILCAACGVPVESRARLLRPALEALKVPAPLVEAALVITGVHQTPWAFTAGQVVHALRGVLRAGAVDRHVVLLFDGLEHFDDLSFEAFLELVTRPAARELTIGFSSTAVSAERLGGAALVELPALVRGEVALLAGSVVGTTPGPRLMTLLDAQAQGLPGRVVDWLGLLDARGALKGGEVVDEVPAFEGSMLPAARLDVLPVEQRRILEAARCSGEQFEAASVMVAWPRATQPAFQALGAARLVVPQSSRRWGFANPGLADVLERTPSPERPSMHQRLAHAMVERGKSDASSVDALEVARHFLAAGDGVRSAALFAHAADQALTRRAPREAALALKGLADGLGLQGAPPAPRVEALSRAAALSLVCLDAGGARALVDEAVALGHDAAELSLSLARVLRSEARRARAVEALEHARELGGETELAALLDVERAETCEQEGDAVGAMVAFELALLGADAAAAVARWHGEVDLVARAEARLAALNNTRKDPTTARRLLESSAQRWHHAGAFAAEARARSNLGSVCAQNRDLVEAATHFAAAAQAAERAGDILFQAKALLQQAKVLKRSGGAAHKPVATEVRRLAVALGWEQGRDEASTLLSG